MSSPPLPSGSTPAGGEDRRSAPRHNVAWKVRYGPGQESYEGEIHNVSAGGVGLKGEKVFPHGTELVVRFTLQDAPEKALVTMTAIVRHSTAHAMGLQFKNIPSQDHMRLMRTISLLMESKEKK